MLKEFMRNHAISCTIVVFIFLFGFMHAIKPSFIYNKKGSFRQFGLGRTKKTVTPIWLITIFLGIFAYMLTLYMLSL